MGALEPSRPPSQRHAVELRVRGCVQGVGFRPTVWRFARELGLDGEVRNDAEGVLIRLAGPGRALDAFRDRLERNPPPLARIDSVEISDVGGPVAVGFRITESLAGAAHTQVSPDARICQACAADIANPADRRFGYGLTNCTHCGPRLSILRRIPYDRASTTMAPFALCADCRAEYGDPGDRRFHAEPAACPACGPKVRCVSMADGREAADPIAFAADRLRAGDILAVKGLGGYQLACDATNAHAVRRLRAGKRREGKPFALMARDLDLIRRYASVDAEAARLLASPQAPIVLLDADWAERLPEAIAPGLRSLGFMLPTTPLHLLLLKDLDRPLVMTSGNLSDSPQITDDEEARTALGVIADHILLHDRAIASRIDDSVVRMVDGVPRLLRRARGYAPAPIALPPGFETAPDILALGGELKATFCLVKDGQAILSQHQGDLEHPEAFDDFRRNLDLYQKLFDHKPKAVAVDRHPEYLSSKLGRGLSLPRVEIQHHHAHIATCLAENGRPLHASPVIGVALDGLGWGEDGTIWGGEFLLADYVRFERLAALQAVAMPGGAAAMLEPWRNLYAHLRRFMGPDSILASPAGAILQGRPLAVLDRMIAGGAHAPQASSTGRLFDAVAAVLGLCPGRQAYEGEAAGGLEALAASSDDDAIGYDLSLGSAETNGVRRLDPEPMWRALLADLEAGTPAPAVAMRFHRGLARAITDTAVALVDRTGVRTVALSGGCFQNRLLAEGVAMRLRRAGFDVLTHARVPANDGGLALGQAAIAAARLIAADASSVARTASRIPTCA